MVVKIKMSIMVICGFIFIQLKEEKRQNFQAKNLKCSQKRMLFYSDLDASSWSAKQIMIKKRKYYTYILGSWNWDGDKMQFFGLMIKYL